MNLTLLKNLKACFCLACFTATNIFALERNFMRTRLLLYFVHMINLEGDEGGRLSDLFVFSENVFSRERVQPCFFVTFKIIITFHWISSSCWKNMELFFFSFDYSCHFSWFFHITLLKKSNEFRILNIISASF